MLSDNSGRLVWCPRRTLTIFASGVQECNQSRLLNGAAGNAGVFMSDGHLVMSSRSQIVVCGYVVFANATNISGSSSSNNNNSANNSTNSGFVASDANGDIVISTATNAALEICVF